MTAKNKTTKRWTREEDEILLATYSKDGLKGAMEALKDYGRTEWAIRCRAWKLQIGSPYCHEYFPTIQYDNPKRWNSEIDAKYLEVKELVLKRVSVTCACEAVGISRDQFYRRRRIEVYGKDRGGKPCTKPNP